MERRALTSADLLRFRVVGDVDLSPDGSLIAHVVQSTDPEKNETQSNLWFARAGSEPVLFTRGGSDRSPRFTPDGRHLAFLSRRSGQSQVWQISLAGGEAEQLTRIQGGVTEYRFAPDMSCLAVVANLDEEGVQPERKEEAETDPYRKHTRGVKVITELYHKLDDYGYFGPRRPQVVIVPLDGGAPRALTQPPYRHSQLAFSPDSRTVYAVANREPAYDEMLHGHIWAFAVDGSMPPQRLSPPELGAAAPTPSPDGQWLAFGASDPEDWGYGNARLYVMRADGTGLRRVAAAADRTFDDRATSDMPGPARAHLTWEPDGSGLYLLSSTHGQTHLVRVDLQTEAVTDVAAGDRVVYAYAIQPGAGVAVTAVADPLNPGDLYQHDLQTGHERRLTWANRELLAELELSVPERFTAQAAGGPPVDGWVMKPVGYQPGRAYPAVLQIHGGPMMMYASAFFFEFQLLAAQGHGVIYTNPRGSQGYGEGFCAAIRERWGELDLADIEAGLATALAENAWIDPQRLGVGGGSYGGYMTAWIIGHTDRFRAAVVGRPVTEWSSMVASGDMNHLWMRRAGGVSPFGEAEVAWYRQQSPITYAEWIVTPVLIEHQEGDLRCPIGQSEALFVLVKRLGKAPVRFVRYPDEFHGMSRTGKPWHRIHRLDEITAWFAQYLGQTIE